MIYPVTRPNLLDICHHKFFWAFCCLWLFGYSAKAEVLLANNNTTGQNSVGDVYGFASIIHFSLSSPAGQSFNLVSLYGASGQGGKELNFNLFGARDHSGNRDIVASETSIGGGSSRYDFDLSSLEGTSNLNLTNKLCITHTFSSESAGNVFTSLYDTTNFNSTSNSTGWALDFYEMFPLQFQISSVPEPGTMLLGAISSVIGGFGILRRRRRKARKSIDSV